MRYIKKLFTLVLCLNTILFLSGCNQKITPDDSKMTIVTTLYPNYEFINAILKDQKDIGKEIEVILIVPYGTDSHSYDPSVSDFITIKNADLFIYTSDEMETWVKGLNLDKEKVLNIYDAMMDKYPDFKELQVLTTEEMSDHDHHHDHNHDDHKHETYKESNNIFDKVLSFVTDMIEKIFPHSHNHSYDPHFWTDMLYAEYMVEVIYDKLIEVIPDPDNVKKVEMRKNADRYIENLRSLDTQFKSVTSLAVDKTIFFGAPFAFFYFTNRYELDYILTYSTCSTEIDPSILVVIEVVEEMKHHNAKVIFSKELTSTTAAETIAEYTGAEILMLHSGHNISPKEAGKISFIEIMQQNVINLAKALNVPTSQIEEFNYTEGGAWVC